MLPINSAPSSRLQEARPPPIFHFPDSVSVSLKATVLHFERIFDCMSRLVVQMYQLTATEKKKNRSANKFTRSTESVRTSLFSYFLYLLLSIRLFSLLPLFFPSLSISPFVLLCPPLHLALSLSLSPHFHLSPLPSPSLSLAVDYFWAAWLISVGSQAQCQGKWNAYKEAKRQTETSKSSLVFFQPLSKTLRRSSVCNISARVFRKFISAAK